jgi:hypothetical protein
MGVLVKYTFELDADDLRILDQLFDQQPHGKVWRLAAKFQSAITAQETVAREKQQSEGEKIIEAWRAAERKKIRDELRAEMKAAKSKAKPAVQTPEPVAEAPQTSVPTISGDTPPTTAEPQPQPPSGEALAA